MLAKMYRLLQQSTYFPPTNNYYGNMFQHNLHAITRPLHHTKRCMYIPLYAYVPGLKGVD